MHSDYQTFFLFCGLETCFQICTFKKKKVKCFIVSVKALLMAEPAAEGAGTEAQSTGAQTPLAYFIQSQVSLKCNLIFGLWEETREPNADTEPAREAGVGNFFAKRATLGFRC